MKIRDPSLNNSKNGNNQGRIGNIEPELSLVFYGPLLFTQDF